MPHLDHRTYGAGQEGEAGEGSVALGALLPWKAGSLSSAQPGAATWARGSALPGLRSGGEWTRVSCGISRLVDAGFHVQTERDFAG